MAKAKKWIYILILLLLVLKPQTIKISYEPGGKIEAEVGLVKPVESGSGLNFPLGSYPDKGSAVEPDFGLMPPPGSYPDKGSDIEIKKVRLLLRILQLLGSPL